MANDDDLVKNKKSNQFTQNVYFSFFSFCTAIVAITSIFISDCRLYALSHKKL
jgi:hypothetical protein